MNYDQMTQDQIDELERTIVDLHNLHLVDIYNLKSKWEPDAKPKPDQKVRWKVWRRDGFRCIYCFTDEVPLTLDHILPETLGGDSTESNLVAACAKCNNRKGDTSIHEFVKTPWLIKKQNQNIRRLSTTMTRAVFARLEDLKRRTRHLTTVNIGLRH